MLSTRTIPSVTPDRWAECAEQARDDSVPLVIRGLFLNQAKSWSPKRFAEQWPTREVRLVVDLPPHGVPYREEAEKYFLRTSLGEFVNLLYSGRSCYLTQVPLSEFSELKAEIDIKDLRLGRIFALNLWMGSKTRSGLHYDHADNLFGQIFGSKRARLVSAKESKYLYPFGDNPSKSQVDLDAPDLRRHPKSARAEIWECELKPGDALFIPRGWWHHITAEDISISINCWHGETFSGLDHLRLFLAGGVRVVSRAAYDFMWHGVMGRSYRHRLFSSPPLGLGAFNKLKSRFR
jgi:hypothetical protein